MPLAVLCLLASLASAATVPAAKAKAYPPGSVSPQEGAKRFAEGARKIRGPNNPLTGLFTARILSDPAFRDRGVSQRDMDNLIAAMRSYTQGQELLGRPSCPPDLLKRAFELRRQAFDYVEKSGPLERPFLECIRQLHGRGGSGGGGRGGSGSREPPSVIMALLDADDAYAGEHYADALRRYRDALAQDPKNAEAWSGASSALLHMGRYEQAYQAAARARALDPRDANAAAVMEFSKGRTSVAGGAGAPSSGASGTAAPAEAAMPAGATSSSASPDSVLTAAFSPRPSQELQEGARDALRLGDPAAAERELSHALALDPWNARTLALRSISRARQRNFAGALADADAGLSLHPKNKLLLHAKAYAQIRGRLWNDGIKTADTLLALDPKDAYAYAFRAHASGGLGDRQAMLDDLRRAASLDPRFQSALETAGSLRLPADSDILFLFPGESRPAAGAAARASGSRARRFALVVGSAVLGGLLLALVLLKQSSSADSSAA